MGALFALWKRQLFIALVSIASLIHLGVFAAYGYLIWAWIVLDIALLVLLLRSKFARDAFTTPHFLLSIPLILSSPWWLEPPRLAWLNTPLNYTYRYHATGETGRQYQLAPRFFAPYGDTMTMANFFHVLPGKRLVGPYGITDDAEIVKALRTAKSAQDVFALEQSHGKEKYDSSRAENYFAFIRNYIDRFNHAIAAQAPELSLGCCGTPPQFWSLPPDNAYTGQEAIRKVTVYEVTTFYNGEDLIELRTEKVKDIDIP